MPTAAATAKWVLSNAGELGAAASGAVALGAALVTTVGDPDGTRAVGGWATIPGGAEGTGAKTIGGGAGVGAGVGTGTWTATGLGPAAMTGVAVTFGELGAGAGAAAGANDNDG